MKTMVVAASLALALSGCGQQGPATGGDTNDAASQLASDQATQAYITKWEAEWAALATARNPGVLERILADDYAGVSDDGTVRNKAQEIEYWAQLPLAAAAEPPKTTLRQFGDTVLFHGDQRLTPEPGGAPSASCGPTSGCSATASGRSSARKTRR
jgi:predicted small lipoprotein YifL